MKKSGVFKRFVSTVLCLAMILSLVPGGIFPSGAVTNPLATVVTDPGTSADWNTVMGTEQDGARYAGRVWVDKSVYKNGDTILLSNLGSNDTSYTVNNLDEANGEYFQIVFSALGSSMSTNTTVTGSRPLDVVLVMDTSTSMDDKTNNVTRMERMIKAANELLEDLTAMDDIRIALVSFNADSETIIGLDKYTNGIVLSVDNYEYKNNKGGVITAKDKNGNVLGKDSGYTSGTNLQDGIDRGMNVLAAASDAEGRTPVAIVMADGRANRAVNDDWYTINSSNRESNGDAGIMLSTLLNAAYGKTKVEKHYDSPMKVYGIGIDLKSTSTDYIFLNPGAAGSAGFNASNTDDNIEKAWAAFVTWCSGTTATIAASWGHTTWTFDHKWPASDITTAEIAANINYVDNYQDVSAANIGSAFDQIYQELATNAFNPITSNKVGATGVENTPLVYADDIGIYMEVKSVQAVQVFGEIYNVTKNSDGTYSVVHGTGFNPTTQESWNTAEDISINVIKNADGTEQLRIYINQEILPVILDKITVETVNDVTTRTIEEFVYPPLRVYYTVGIRSDVLLPSGEVDLAKIDSDYAYVNSDGTVSFYSNAFGGMNIEDRDSDGLVELGDAHVGFVPSHENRFYYHQAHQEIFISATKKDGSDIVWEEGEYGVVWDDSKYTAKPMTYADYASMSDNTEVYTFITFTRPTGSGSEAEEVTYLIYATWGSLKESVTFYDKVNGATLNSGNAIELDLVESTVAAYKSGKSVGNSDLISVVGLQSRRVSRLNNMFEYKTSNATSSAELAYAPAYNRGAHDEGDIHEHNEVIVWLGNNGRVTLPIGAGIKVTKSLVDVAQGSSPTEKFEIKINIDTEKTAADLTVVGGTAADVGDNVLVTADLANGESVYVYGVAGGDTYTVAETAHDKYVATYTGATAAVAGTIAEGIVSNEAVKPGGLYITKEVEHKVAGEAFPTGYEFDFKVTFVDKNGDPIANTVFALENNYEPELTSLTTDANGVMTGKLRHGETVYIKGIPAGATVTVEEVGLTADGNYTLKSYRSRNYSGAVDDADGSVVISSDRNATVVVTNEYAPKATTVDLDVNGKKNFTVDNSQFQIAGSFTFIVEKWNGTAWEDVSGKSAVLNYAANEGGSTKYFTIEDVLAGETFDRAGAYSYQVREEIGSVSNVTYDRTLYTFTVNVADVNGQLVATVTDKDNEEIENGEYAVEFNNSYNTATVNIDIKKDVVDTSDNPSTSKAGFEFVARTAEVNDAGQLVVKNGGRSYSVFSDAAGEARMTDVYTAEGSYYYIISEAAGSAGGWTYSDVEYHVTVVVSDDVSGKLSAAMTIEAVNGSAAEVATVSDNTRGTVVFTNTYDPADAEVSLNTLVKKELSGRTMAADEFEFEIYANGDRTTALATGTNDASGNVAFTPNKLTFTEVGDYFFDIVEKAGDNGGMTYDTTVYDLVVEVYDNGDGTLGARYYFEDSVDTTVTFKNTYTVTPVEIVIDGVKTLQVLSGNKALNAGDYTFGLFGENGEEIARTTNLANGTFAFDAIVYDHDDIGATLTYTVREIAPDGTTDGSYTANGVKWSSQNFTVTVAVTDNGDGTLSTVVRGNGRENISFVNTYSSNPASVILGGKKVLENRELVAGEFTFSLFMAESGFANPAVINNSITHDADGNISIDLGNLGSGFHYFIVKENVPESPANGIKYSGAEYGIIVNVYDTGVGQMQHSCSVTNLGNNASEDIVFTNVYSPVDGKITLDGTKIYNGGVDLEDGAFSVGLYYDGELISVAEVNADGTFTFEELSFGAADVGNTYELTVKEIIPDGAVDNGDGTKTYGNVIYDAGTYTVSITVKDDVKDGVLEITRTVEKNGTAVNGIDFTNTYVPDPIEYAISAEKSYDKGLNGNDFDFTLVSADDKTNVNQTKKNDAEGIVSFDPIIFEAEGEYKFTLKEKKDGILSFIRSSNAEYEITVTVVMENGVLIVESVTSVNTKNTGESDLKFENVYVLDDEDEITLSGTKKLTGDRTTVEANEFEFGLYDSEGNLIEAVKNDADGKFAFTALKFDETGIPVNGSKEYTYTVKEIAGDNARYTYDTTVYTVVVTVCDNDEGGIDVSYTVNGVDGKAIEFTNTYEDPAPVTYTPVAKKSYNKPLKGEDFKFTLEGEINGTEVKQEKTNAADGSITFDKLSFPEAGTYTFKVKEIAQILGFIKYSKAEYEIVVNVIDTKGVLSLGAVTINDDPNGTIEFINTYTITGNSEVTVNGEKSLTGRELGENEFEFRLAEVDAEGKEVENGKVLTAKNDKDGKFSFKLSYIPEDIGTHYYKVSEVKGELNGVTYDETVYTVKVVVSDNDEGGIKTEATVEENASIVFENSFKAETVLDVNVKKTVKSVGSEAIGPEGFEFVLENTTTGLKTVLTSDKNGDALVSLGYNEADIGKTYAYTLSEVKGDKENVTYSEEVYNISVTLSVDENGKLVSAVTVNGSAAESIVCEFENVYDNTPEPPDTGVNLHIGLWAMMMAVSVLGICGLIVFKKRGER